MAADFSVQFIVNEKTSSKVITLTDTSSGITLAQGNFTVTYPDGSKRIKSDFNLADITALGQSITINALIDANNALITGTYKVDYTVITSTGIISSQSQSFNLNWIKPTKSIVNLSDTMIPEVKFQDSTSYATSGSFTGVVTSRVFNVLMPTTSAVSGQTVTGSSGLIDASISLNYYEGDYSPKSDIIITYTHTTYSWLKVIYTDALQTTFTIKKAPTRADLVLKINAFRTQIDAYQTINDTQFQTLNLEYDLLMSLYMHLIERAQSSTLDGSQNILVLILNILYKYTPYTYQSGPISGFYIAPQGTGTVTSVGLSVPTGFSVTNSPIVGSGVIGLSFASGFSLPTDASQAAWSAKQNALSGTGFVKSTAGVISYDTNTYITGNQSITLSGAVTGSGTTAITTTLANGVVGIANHSATGTPSASTILRGDNTWATYYTGTVTNVSVLTANGFTGTVATSATTPAITITTSITGILKGNGTAISAAVAGTDYLTSVGISNLTATGTPSATTYLRGDNTWATITAGNSGTVTSVAALTLGTTGTDLSSTVANGSTTPVITLNVPTASASNRGALSSSDWTTFNSKQGALTLTTTGTSGAATLVGNTLNIPQYTGGGGGSVTTVSVVSANGFAGTVATATSTPAITISTSITGIIKGNGTAISAASAGTDYQAPITLTTTGSSGSATFITNTLNIPTYTLAGLGGQASSTNLTSLSGLTYASASFVKMTAAGTFTLDTNTYYLASNPNGYTANLGTVTSVAALTLGTTGTDLSSTVANGTTAAVITLNVPTASATNRGALSSADWTTFNGKQGALTLTTTGTTGAATLVGNTLNIPQYVGGVSSFNTRTGAITLTSGDVTGALTYTPVPPTRTLTINGTAFDLSTDRSWTISGSGGSSIGSFSRTIQTFTATAAQTTFTISGGYTAGYIDVYVNGVRLTGADYTASNGTTVVMGTGLLVNDIVDITIYNGIALSGTAPISFNSTTGAISISQATTSTNGYLSSTDWNTFNNKFSTPTGVTTQYVDGTGALQTFPTGLPSNRMLTDVRNSTGSTLYKGTVVYISGSTGNLPNVVKAQANAESTSAGTFGIIYADLPNNSNGQVVNLGTIDTLDTRSTATNPFTDVTLADGDTVYLHPTVAGYITNVKPSAPYHLVYVGKVTRTSPTNGTIVYRIQNGYELDEIHDVQVGSYVNKDILYRDTTTNLWKNASIATVLGYTPLNTASPAYTGTLGTGTLTYTPANLFLYAQQSTNSYVQAVFQNSNSGTAASTDIVVNNDLSTDSTYYGTFGMNSSGYSGSGSFNLPNATYLSATTGDLVLGTTTVNAVRIVISGATTDSLVVKTSSQLQLPSYTATSSFSGTVVGYLAFDASGNILTASAPSGGGVSGTTNSIAKFTSSSAIGDSIISDNGTLVAINGTSVVGATSIVSTAQFQIDSTTKGFLPPRMTSSQRTGISSPATGLVVYQTDSVEGLYINTSTGWRTLTMV